MGQGVRVFRGHSKKNELIAELSYWYGFDVGALPKERQAGLWCNLPRVQAQDRIFHDQYDELNHPDVYRLFFDAYGDEDLAREAQTDAARLLVRHETEAARQSTK